MVHTIFVAQPLILAEYAAPRAFVLDDGLVAAQGLRSEDIGGGPVKFGNNAVETGSDGGGVDTDERGLFLRTSGGREGIARFLIIRTRNDISFSKEVEQVNQTYVWCQSIRSLIFAFVDNDE